MKRWRRSGWMVRYGTGGSARKNKRAIRYTYQKMESWGIPKTHTSVCRIWTHVR